MTRVVTAPFLRARPGRVHPTGWEFLRDGAWHELANAIPEWDYATDITLRRRFDIDETAVRDDCQLGSDTPLGVSVCWHATGTNRRGAFGPAKIEADRATVIGTLTGAELGGQLHLRSRLVLVASAEKATPLSPRRPGSILWSDISTVYLEGGAAMFPIEAVDFAQAGLAPSMASWYLDWSPADPATATLGSVRLYINSALENVRRAAISPDADTTTAAIISALRHDVLRQMIEGALDNSDFDDRTEYPAGSLGASMRTALRIAFGADPVDVVRALRRTARAEFEARIQAASGLFSR